MFKLLQLSTYGIKNLEKKATINFANTTVEGGLKKVNKVKGIYGYNGAGKSALMEAAYYYQRIALKPDYLLDTSNKERLSKLINFKRKEFYVSMVFLGRKKKIFKHEILIKRDEDRDGFVIEKETLSRLHGRSLDGKYEELIVKEGEHLEASFDGFGHLGAESLRYSSITALASVKSTQAPNPFEKEIIENFLAFASSIQVFISEEDKHIPFSLSKEWASSLPWTDPYSGEVVIKKEQYEEFLRANEKLERFLLYLKPSIQKIKLKVSEDREKLHIRRSFAYEDYDVDLEFESSGLRQLVKLYPYLRLCAGGAIAFIDEIDANINSIYLEKMVSFFLNYGEGQLIFTTHNLETMTPLRKESRAIIAIGEDGQIDTWTRRGNRTPQFDYAYGNFENSPMNIEDFDFIYIFQGE